MKIKKEIIDKIFEHGEKESPIEACGYLAGHDEMITDYFSMTNVDQSPEHFSLDPKEQFSIVKEIRNAGLDLMAVYHTHPHSPARPSEEDVRLAYDPTVLYLIASLLDNQREIKVFKIVRGEVSVVKFGIV